MKNKKFTTELRAAKVHGRYGWKDKTDAEAKEIAANNVQFRRVDSGNLARLATAAEKIAGYLARITKCAERESERV